MSDELKPCPFCGGAPSAVETEYQYELGTDYAWEIVCPMCGVSMLWADETSSKSYEKLVTDWNTRATEDALRARAAELEAENARLREAVGA